MVIRDIDLLIDRLNWHRNQDNLMHGEYGDLKTNGEADFKGCAMGCAVVPSGLAGVREFAARIKDSFGDALPTHVGDSAYSEELRSEITLVQHDELGEEVEPFYLISLDDDWEEEQLGEQFGLCPNLVRMAEAIFEQATFPVSAELLLRFAEVLKECEGADIEDKDVLPLWEELGGHTREYGSRMMVAFLGKTSRVHDQLAELEVRLPELARERMAVGSQTL